MEKENVAINDLEMSYKDSQEAVFNRSKESPPGLNELKNLVEDGLKYYHGKIQMYPPGIGRLQNEGNLTLDNLETQFQRAKAALENERRNADSVAWVLQYSGEKYTSNYVREVIAITHGEVRHPKDIFDTANRNIQKVAEIAAKENIKFDPHTWTPIGFKPSRLTGYFILHQVFPKLWCRLIFLIYLLYLHL